MTTWSMRWSGSALLAASLLMAATVVPTGASAQGIPDEFTNLQLLPEDISRAQLTNQMRNWSVALGVRCSYCHMVSDQLNSPDDDFASDEKAAKEKARAMMQMVGAINNTHLAALPSRSEPAVRVGCTTCHGGVPIPESMSRLLPRLVADEGIDAAVERFRQLRAQFYGGTAYDFREGSIATAAQSVAEDSPSAAITLLELNVEYEMAGVQTYFTMGQVHELAGNNADAIAAYRRVLELVPNNRQAQARITALGG